MTPTVAADAHVRAFEAEAKYRHELWSQHERFCVRCAVGDPCRVASDLADDADVAGRRLQIAQGRLW